jgi:hypothetical protein
LQPARLPLQHKLQQHGYTPYGPKAGITDAGYRGPLLFLAFTLHRRSVIRDGISF